jgi:hypothetical protein
LLEQGAGGEARAAHEKVDPRVEVVGVPLVEEEGVLA